MKKVIIISVCAAVTLYILSFVTSCSSTSITASSRSGAQLWGENCMRCHNAPSPITFSDVEWEVAVPHMRIRANLTEIESEKILEFMKSAN
jgi:hypothetical protein